MHLVYIMRMRGEAVFFFFLHAAPSFSVSGLLDQSRAARPSLPRGLCQKSFPDPAQAAWGGNNGAGRSGLSASKPTSAPLDLHLPSTHPWVLDLSLRRTLKKKKKKKFFLQIYKLTAYKAELIMEIYDNPFDSLWPLPHSSTFHFLFSRYGKWWSES